MKTIEQLTARELEVLRLTALGLMWKEMSGELGISPKTIEKHAGKLRKRLGIFDTARLTHYALANGLIQNLYEPTNRNEVQQ